MQANHKSTLSSFSAGHKVRDNLRPSYGEGIVTTKGASWVCVKYPHNGVYVSYQNTELSNLVNITAQNRIKFWEELIKKPTGTTEIKVQDLPEFCYFIQYGTATGSMAALAYRKDKTGITRLKDNINMHAGFDTDDKVVIVDRTTAIEKTHIYFKWYNSIG